MRAARRRASALRRVGLRWSLYLRLIRWLRPEGDAARIEQGRAALAHLLSHLHRRRRVPQVGQRLLQRRRARVLELVSALRWSRRAAASVHAKESASTPSTTLDGAVSAAGDSLARDVVDAVDVDEAAALSFPAQRHRVRRTVVRVRARLGSACAFRGGRRAPPPFAVLPDPPPAGADPACTLWPAVDGPLTLELDGPAPGDANAPARGEPGGVPLPIPPPAPRPSPRPREESARGVAGRRGVGARRLPRQGERGWSVSHTYNPGTQKRVGGGVGRGRWGCAVQVVVNVRHGGWIEGRMGVERGGMVW